MRRLIFGWELRFVFETLQTDSSPIQPAAAGRCHYFHFSEEEILAFYIRIAVVRNLLLNYLSQLLFTVLPQCRKGSSQSYHNAERVADNTSF